MVNILTRTFPSRWRRVAGAAVAAGLLAAIGSYDPAGEAANLQSITYTDHTSSPLHLTPDATPMRLAQDTSDTGAVCTPGEPAPLADSAFSFTSKVLKAPRWFNAVGFKWVGDLPAGARVLIDTRSSEDGVVFTQWARADELDAERGGAVTSTDLVFTSGAFIQYRFAVEDAPAGWSGTVENLDITYIDSTNGPTAEAAAAASGGSLVNRLSQLIAPSVLGRSSWGANEKLRYDKTGMIWPPSYATVKKIIIHHTATPSNPEDPAAVVRAIYQYHTVSQGWGDIGYNFLIDQEGRVYEGRFGGRNVVGAHALQYNKGSLGVAIIGSFDGDPPSAKANAAIDKFVLSKAVEFGIDPKGTGFFIDKDLPNIMGHRDAVVTSCPGTAEYAQLAGLRDRVLANMPPYGQSWTLVKAPKLMEPGSTNLVEVTVRNSGSAAWTPGAKDPVRVGYHWVREDGSPYTEDDMLALELHTDLPRVVNPGDGVTLKASVKAPAAIGRYTLQWDMLQERVTWFQTQGNVPFEVAVVVAPLTSLPNEKLIDLPNDLLVLVPAERLRTLPLSRLSQMTNDDLLTIIPDMLAQLTNERVLSFGNDILLKYLPDARLKTFSMERIRTFPSDVQTRLGISAPAPATSKPAEPVSAPPTSSPVGSSGNGSTPPPSSPVATSSNSDPAPATPTNTDPGGGVAP